jgi:hemolysin III
LRKEIHPLRIKLADRQLPGYSKGEEIFNMVSHIAGGALGIVVLVLCVFVAAEHDNIYGIVSAAVYGTTMIMLYAMSSIYHGLNHLGAKKVFQVFDHCAIYFLIAGTYTPIALSGLRPIYPTLGWSVFGFEWGFAALAVTLTAIDLKRYSVFSMVCYIAMGWSVVFIYKQAIEALTFDGFILLLVGGVIYTIGAVLYGVGVKKKYMHNAFHIFVLLGSLVQFFAILFFAL